MKEIPIWEKSNLTLEEAAAYSGIGVNKLRKLTDSEQCCFVLWIGSKRLIKRKKLDEYIEKHTPFSCGPYGMLMPRKRMGRAMELFSAEVKS